MAFLKQGITGLLVTLACSFFGVARVAAAGPELITAAPAANGSTASGFSAGGQISGDGRFVLFQSTASDVSPSRTWGGVVNLFLADRQENTVTLISKNAAGSGGANASCVNATMSDDGKFVVFETTATNLVGNDNDDATDIYLRDVAAGTTVRLSTHNLDLAPSHRGSSTNASISGTGQRIVYKSGPDLAAASATKIPLFYLYDRSVGTNRIVWSINMSSIYTNMTFEPVISKSGRMVFFEAVARNLVTGATTYGRQAYAYDLETEELQLISSNVMTVLNRPANTVADHYLRGVSSNGNVAVFLSNVPAPSNPSVRTNYLFRHSLSENVTELIATNVNWATDGVAPFPEIAVSADGQFVAYGLKGNIYRWDAAAKESELVSVTLSGAAVLNSTNVSAPFMSADGRYVAFVSAATNLVEGVSSTTPQLYRRDMLTQTTTLVTAQPGGILATNTAVYDGSISDDGKSIVFTSTDEGLADGDINGGPDCLIWDETKTPRISPVSKLSSVAKTFKAHRFLSVSPQPMSSNGRIVAFSGQLEAVGIAPQIWLRDRTQKITKLVSFEPTTGDSYTSASYNAFVSADGRWIGYQTSASNLVSGVTDTNNAVDVILYDAQTETNRLVTMAANQSRAAISGGELRAMSLDGRYLAIASASTALMDPPVAMTGPGTAVYLWDRVSGAFQLITHGANASGIRGAHTNIVFSPDSRRLAMFAVGAVQYIDARTGLATQGSSAGAVTLLIHEMETGLTKGYVASSVSNRVLAFSPDGTKLFTTVLNTLPRGVTRIDLATGAEDSITFNAGQATAFDSSLGGETLAFTMDTTAPFIGLVDFVTGQSNVIATVSAKYPTRPEINADGSVIIFQNYANSLEIGDTNGYPNPVIFDLAAQTLTPIGNGDGPTVGHVLSADGSTLLTLTQSSDLVAEDNNNSMDLVAFAITAAPKIRADLDGALVELRFAATDADYILETASAVDANAASWQQVSADRTVVGDSVVVRVSLSDAMRFFRLRK